MHFYFSTIMHIGMLKMSRWNNTQQYVAACINPIAMMILWVGMFYYCLMPAFFLISKISVVADRSCQNHRILASGCFFANIFLARNNRHLNVPLCCHFCFSCFRLSFSLIYSIIYISFYFKCSCSKPVMQTCWT